MSIDEKARKAYYEEWNQTKDHDLSLMMYEAAKSKPLIAQEIVIGKGLQFDVVGFSDNKTTEQPDGCHEAFEKWMMSQGFDIPVSGFWEQKMQKAWQAAWDYTYPLLPVRESGGWQPIETAPKNGDSILTYTNRAGHGIMVMYWGRTDSYSQPTWLTHPNSINHIDKPILWRPLEMPTITDVEGEK